MPPVFAQPTPIARSYGSDGGGGGSFGQLASILQSRYAADADRQARMQLGFAQLGAEQQNQQQQLSLRAQELSQRPALLQQQSDQEISNWLIKQRFTQADAQEMARQQTNASKLQDELDAGKISRDEFYSMFADVAPRVNYLQAKEQHTRTQAIAQQKQQEAELFKARKEQIDTMNAIQQGELGSQIDVHIPAENAQFMSDHMALVYPDLQPGTPAYDAKMKMDAAQLGRGQEFIRTKSGLVPVSTVKGLQGGSASGSGTGGKAADHDKASTDALDKAIKFFADKGESPGKDALQEKALEFAAVIGGVKSELSGEAGRARAQADTQKTLQNLNNSVDLIAQSPNLGSGAKLMATKTINDLRTLLERYPPEKRTGEVAKRIDTLKEQFKQFMYSVQQQQPTPAAPPPEPVPQPTPGNGTPEWWQRFNRGELVTARGIGQSVVRGAKQLNEGNLVTLKDLRSLFE